MTDPLSPLLIGLLVALAVVSLLLVPRTRTAEGFFLGQSPQGMAPGAWTLTFSQVTTWIFARSLLNAGLLRYFFGIAGLYGLLRFIATHFLKQVAISGRDDGLMHPLTLKKRSQKRPCVLIKWLVIPLSKFY